MIYNKNLEENLKDYKIRLCKNKDIYGLTFQDIANLINKESGENKSESVYRKWWTAYNEGYQDAERNSLDNDDIIKEYEEKRIEAEKAKYRFFDQRNSYNKIVREQARFEELKDIISDSISKLVPIEVPPIIKDYGNSEECICLCFGDEHFGTEFSISDLDGNIINSYSPEVFYNRMWNLLSQTVSIIKERSARSIKVYSLGDYGDGVLRVSQLIHQRYGIVESTILYADFVSTWLNELSKYAKVEFQMVDGNHTELRMLSQPKGTFKNENMGMIVRYIIKEKLKNNKNFDIIENPTGYIYDNIFGYRILGIHGEEKNMINAIKDFSFMYNTRIDYLIGGHFHHNKKEDSGYMSEVINIPSIIGPDNYSVSLKKVANAGAKIFVFGKEKGIKCEYNIILN